MTCFSIFGPSIILLVVAEVSRRHTWTSVGLAYYNKIKSYSSVFFLLLKMKMKMKKKTTIIVEYGLRLRTLEDCRFSPCDCRDTYWSCHDCLKMSYLCKNAACCGINAFTCQRWLAKMPRLLHFHPKEKSRWQEILNMSWPLTDARLVTYDGGAAVDGRNR